MNLEGKVIPFQPLYRSGVIELYTSEFSRFVDNCDDRVLAFANRLTPEKTLLALVDDNLAGFSHVDTILPFYHDFLLAALNPEVYDSDFLSWIKKGGFPGQPFIEYFPELFTQLYESDITPSEHDVHVEAFAIHPDFRNNRIGLNLAKATLDLIKSNNPLANVYATIVENSPAYDIALREGFVPLLKIGPFYEDGSAAIAVVRRMN